MKKYLLSLFALSLVFTVITNAGAVRAEAASIPELYNTGVDNSNALLSGGATDPHYTLITSADAWIPGPAAMVVYDSIYPFPFWSTDGPDSKWIAPLANEGVIHSGGMYTYRITFDLTGFDFSSAVIIGQWVSDNNGVDILINGISTGYTNAGWFYDASGFSAFTISNGFSPGVNTLDFVVYNVPNYGPLNPTGLRVEMSGTANSSSTPEPTTILLYGLGFAGAGLYRRMRRRK